MDEGEDLHDYCLECECILTWREGNICCWCEERIETEELMKEN